MPCLFLEYPKCSTCQKAQAWLKNNNITFVDRHIVENNPTYDELKNWIKLSKRPIKSFFNTSGLLYKELSLKEKLPVSSDDEQIKILASNGMLIKRPLLICDSTILSGFNPENWKQLIK